MKVLFSLLAFLTSTQVMAGSYNYGCMGNLPNHTIMKFESGSLMMFWTELPNASNVFDSTYTIYQSTDQSFMEMPKVLNFKGPQGETVKLEELSSVRTSKSADVTQCGRDVDNEQTRKTYKITTYVPYIQRQEKPITATLKCFEASVSACGSR